MAAVQLKQVSKEYSNGFKAVHGIDLEIVDGEFMVFVGPSGCAKSTTLRMIAGLEESTGGEIYIGNKLVNNLPPKDRGIAMVFQNYALYPHMTVYENMAFGLKVAKLPKAEIEKRVTEAAEKLEITELLHKKPKEMSGGQRQRVAVGRAIVRKPDVFLFDEPLSNLDAKLRVSMRIRITQLHKELSAAGQTATMIYVTHDQVEAMTMGDRICILNYGKIMQVDTPLNVYNYPQNKFVAGFIGSPAMNLLKAKVNQAADGICLQFNSTLELALPVAKSTHLLNYIGKEIWFGIRPEHMNLVEDKDLSGGYESGLNALVIGKVDIVEQMGNEAYIYFTLGESKLIARTAQLSSDRRYEMGDTLKFHFMLEHCHLFDVDTEENIGL